MMGKGIKGILWFYSPAKYSLAAFFRGRAVITRFLLSWLCGAALLFSMSVCLCVHLWRKTATNRAHCGNAAIGIAPRWRGLPNKVMGRGMMGKGIKDMLWFYSPAKYSLAPFFRGRASIPRISIL
jgi:hypothetical protein